MKIERILFATDFFESSRLALDYAVAFAQHFGASITMLHVALLSQAAHEAELEISGPSVSRKTAEQRLHTLAEGVRRLGLHVETHVVDGFACEVILESTRVYKADLLVIGTHGVHRGLGYLLIGSNAEKILRGSDCPVMTVGAHVSAGVDLQEHLREVIYFSDFTEEATAAAPYALFFGRAFRVPIDLCLLLPPAAERNKPLQKQLAEEYCQQMRAAVEDEEQDWCTPAYQLDRGLELDQIVERAESQSAGLIVLGVRHLHTSFAYQVLARATCPVITIRHTEPVKPKETR